MSLNPVSKNLKTVGLFDILHNTFVLAFCPMVDNCFDELKKVLKSPTDEKTPAGLLTDLNY
jgi:hypothetical protein